MITIKTNVAKAIYNNRSRKIGDFIIYLTISELREDINGVTALGHYYYYVTDIMPDESEVQRQVVLDSVNTFYSWAQIEGVEAQAQLPSLATPNFKVAVFQRLKQFTVLQQTIDSGNNYEILFSEWDFS